MKINASTISIAAILAVACISSAMAIGGSEMLPTENSAGDYVLRIMQAENATNYTQEEQQVLSDWNSLMENIDHQNTVLSEAISGNITYTEAMTALTAILVLNSQSLDVAEDTKPTYELSDFHENTLNAMKTFNVYLYDMAKYFETRDGKYARSAGAAWNLTQEYYELGREEVNFLF